MNKRIFAVARKNFKEKFIGFFPNTKVPGMPKNHILRVLVLLISYLVMGFFSYIISEVLATILVGEMGLDASYFTYSGILVSLTLIIFSIFEIISDFYTSKDTEIMLSMPLKDDDIFLGKLIGNIASDIDYFIFFTIIMLVYFLKTSFDIVKLFTGIISFVCLIVIAYCLLSLVIMVVMRFTNARKYKTLFKFIGYGLGLLVFGLYYYFLFSSNDFDFDQKDIDIAMESFNNFRLGLEKIFYPSTLFGRAVGEKDIVAFGILVLIAVLSFLLVKFVASKIYLDSIIEKQGQKSKKNKKAKRADFKSSSQTMAIARKEFASVIKNPVFLFQSGLLVVMTTAILISTGNNLDFKDLQMEFPTEIMKNFYAITFIAGLLISSFLFSSNVTVFSSLSREGKSFYLIQTLPIDPSSNILGRFLGLYFINLIASVLVSIVLTLVWNISIIQGLLFFTGMAFGGVFPVLYGLYWGTKKIYTTWEKPAEINKTGLIGLAMFLVSMLINAVIYGLGFGIYMLSESLTLAILEVVVGLIIASVLFYLFGVEKYKQGFFDVK